MSRGIYILANDDVFDLTVALLNSIRMLDLSISVCIIPFDEKTARIRGLGNKFSLSFFEDHSVLSECDQWSLLFHPVVKGHYRKLAMWRGEFEEFIYIDTDTVFLRDPTFSFGLLSKYRFISGHSNVAHTRQFVWRTTPSRMTIEDVQYSAGTGFFCTDKKEIRYHDFSELISSALELKPAMELRCNEQALLNYIVIRSTRAFTSLHVLRGEPKGSIIPCECWAGDRNWVITEDLRTLYNGSPIPVLFIHWAGKWTARGYRGILNRLWTAAGMKGRLLLRRNMPMKMIWLRFRNATFASP